MVERFEAVEGETIIKYQELVWLIVAVLVKGVSLMVAGSVGILIIILILIERNIK